MATKSYAKSKAGTRSPTATTLSSISRTTGQSVSPLGKSAKKSYKKSGTENDFPQFGNISFGNTGMTGED